MSGRRRGRRYFLFFVVYQSQSQCTGSPVQPSLLYRTGQSHINLYTLALVVRDKAAEEDRMVLLYQLDCNKVLDLLDDNVAVSEEQFSDYWGDNNMRCRILPGLFLLQFFVFNFHPRRNFLVN